MRVFALLLSPILLFLLLFDARATARTVPAITGQTGSGCIAWYHELGIEANYQTPPAACVTHIPLPLGYGTTGYHDITIESLEYGSGDIQCRAQVLTSSGAEYQTAWYENSPSYSSSFTIPNVYVGPNDALGIQCSIWADGGFVYTVTYTE